jgi:hypothetical protein
MFLHRKANGVLARRNLARLDRGSPGAVFGLQLTGLTMDLVRGALLTLLAYLALRPAVAALAARWTLDPETTRGALLAVAAAAAAGAAWRLFHGAQGAAWWFAGGLGAGIALLFLVW